MIASDSVDEEMVKKTLRWNLNFIRDFMITFGLISSFFDYLTFAFLLIGFMAQEMVFQRSWFTVSNLTKLMVLLVMRTHKSFYRSKLLLFYCIHR